MESEVITLQDIFSCKAPDQDAGSGSFGRQSRLLTPLLCTGLKPHFLDKLAANGVALHATFFTPDEDVGAAAREVGTTPRFGAFE